ncbi:MAG: protein-export chaperone SecB [Rhodospirillales bacterium]|nr:protein-export chaperone SecB [Rhodospirillales bacterium]
MADDELDDIIPAERFTPEPDSGNAGDAGADSPPLMINGQYVKDLSFEAPNAPEVFTLMQSEVPAIQVDIDVEAEPKGENLFEVTLTVRAEAKLKDELAYLCEIEYAGLFTVNVPEEHLGPVLLIECPLIVFPFLRRIIADVTGDGGFAPLMLAPIDFAALYQQRMMAAQEAKQSEGSGDQAGT